MGELDFVLTDAIATYVDKFDYPPRQCIPLPKLVVRTDRPPVGRVTTGLSDDLVFVSNASGAARRDGGRSVRPVSPVRRHNVN